jgi:hypothetical protein
MSDKYLDPDRLYTEKENFLVVLDSRNATGYTNDSMHSSVHFDFNEPIRFTKNSIRLTCSVLHFQSPNSLYNINETNSILTTLINGVTTIYYIDYGNYNANTLLSKLISLLPSAFTITFNTTTNKFKFVHATNDFTIGGTIAPIIGFQTSVLSTSQSLTMPYTCNFNGIQNLNIHMTNIVTKNVDSFNKSPGNIIQSIPVEPGSNTISYIKNADFNFIVNQDIIDDIQIDLKDDLNNYLNFNNQHWNLTLYFSIIRDIDRFANLNNFHSILYSGTLY